MQRCPMFFDLERVLAAEVGPEVLDLSGQCRVLVLEAAFADAGDAGVGVDADKEPVVARLGMGLHTQDFDIGDLHGWHFLCLMFGSVADASLPTPNAKLTGVAQRTVNCLLRPSYHRQRIFGR